MTLTECQNMEAVLCYVHFSVRRFGKENIEALASVIEDLIVKHSVDKFYVGNDGNFDHSVRDILQKFEEKYPHIIYYVVLAYLPGEVEKEGYYKDFAHTIMPEGFEHIPYKAAICYRNEWMLKNADYVVGYIKHNACSGAANYFEMAKRKKKKCINIAVM